MLNGKKVSLDQACNWVSELKKELVEKKRSIFTTTKRKEIINKKPKEKKQGVIYNRQEKEL